MRRQSILVLAIGILACVNTNAVANITVTSDFLIQGGDIYDQIRIFNTEPDITTVTMTDVSVDTNEPPEECLKDTDPGYSTWEACGKPDCYCYRHQCQGDADGLAAFGRYVGLSDLECLKRCFGLTLTEIMAYGLCDYCLCCDFDHLMVFGRLVALSELNILKANFGVPGLPDCPPWHLNYYTEP